MIPTKISKRQRLLLIEEHGYTGVEIDFFEFHLMCLVKVPLNQNEFDALVDLLQSCGLAEFMASSVLLHLNAGEDRKKIVEHIMSMNKIGGIVSKSLTERRMREAQLWLAPVQERRMSDAN
jgi:lysozyme